MIDSIVREFTQTPIAVTVALVMVGLQLAQSGFLGRSIRARGASDLLLQHTAIQTIFQIAPLVFALAILCGFLSRISGLSGWTLAVASLAWIAVHSGRLLGRLLTSSNIQLLPNQGGRKGIATNISMGLSILICICFIGVFIDSGNLTSGGDFWDRGSTLLMFLGLGFPGGLFWYLGFTTRSAHSLILNNA